MERLRLRPLGLLSAILIAAAILVATSLLADGLRRSEVYSRSRFLTEILSEEAVDLRDLATDLADVDMLFKFAGAVTSAYIDFELIPVGEADTFVAMFESKPPSVKIDRFAYHGKNLSIYGAAPSTEEYGAFVSSLTETGYFESVTGSLTEGDGTAFRIDTVARGSGEV